jgi:phosphoglycerate kinase
MVELTGRDAMNEQTDFVQALRRIRFHDPEIDSLSLKELVALIPALDESESVRAGTHLLVRLDVDVPIKGGVVTEPVRLESGNPTLEFCLKRNCKIVILGHVGRDASATLRPVATALSDMLRRDVAFVEHWFDESTNTVTPEAVTAVARMPASSMLLFENCRKYSIERALWKVKPDALPQLAPTSRSAALSIREHISSTEINEAIAASNADFSSCVLPLVMDYTALGFFVREELGTHAIRAQEANLVVFSGLKIDKLDDLESIVDRLKLRTVLAAGSLAMALKKAEARLAGGDFSIGLAETDPSNKAYIASDRVDQAARILSTCQPKGTRVVLPVDFKLDDGSISETIPADRVQMDIGPRTIELIRTELRAYAAESRASAKPHIMFTNGVFGKFEDPRFEHGTREFIAMVREISSDVRIYVGGGEGRAALENYGSLADVEHAFTAGGTILKCLGGKHVAYLKALWMQNRAGRRVGR